MEQDPTLRILVKYRPMSSSDPERLGRGSMAGGAVVSVCEVGYYLSDLLVAGMTRLTHVQRTSVTDIGSGG